MSQDREVTSNEDLSALLRLIFEEAAAQLPDLAPILSTAIEQHNANVARIAELEEEQKALIGTLETTSQVLAKTARHVIAIAEALGVDPMKFEGGPTALFEAIAKLKEEATQSLTLKLYHLPADSIVRMLDESKRWQRLNMAANFRQWALKNVGTQQGEST